MSNLHAIIGKMLEEASSANYLGDVQKRIVRGQIDQFTGIRRKVHLALRSIRARLGELDDIVFSADSELQAERLFLESEQRLHERNLELCDQRVTECMKLLDGAHQTDLSDDATAPGRSNDAEPDERVVVS